jgi:thioredoxin-like negative regulator of GroEL
MRISSDCEKKGGNLSNKGGFVTIINEKTNANKKFETFIKNHKNVICLYHWLSCGFCMSFVSIWNNVISKFKDEINVISIELEAIKNIDKKYQVSAFPTIVIFRNGAKYKEFTKARTEKELTKFIKENLLKNK